MIRKANINDISSINELGTLVDINFEILYDIEKYLVDKSKLLYVYEINNKVIGFALLNNLLDELELLAIAVDKKYQNKKVASKMLNLIFNKENKDCFLEVNENNKIAIRLYENLGFSIINIRKQYYNKDNALVMKKNK